MTSKHRKADPPPARGGSFRIEPAPAKAGAKEQPATARAKPKTEK